MTNRIALVCTIAAASVAVVGGVLLGARVRAPVAPQAFVSTTDPIEAGKYLVMVGGCNYCHTPGYEKSGGKTAESEWLKGNTVGWHGAWGTTYPPNLRMVADRATEDVWVTTLKNLNARPPMPNANIHSMSERDLRALYKYIKSLPGGLGVKAPDALPAGVEPPGDVIEVPPSVTNP